MHYQVAQILGFFPCSATAGEMAWETASDFSEKFTKKGKPAHRKVYPVAGPLSELCYPLIRFFPMKSIVQEQLDTAVGLEGSGKNVGQE